MAKKPALPGHPVKALYEDRVLLCFDTAKDMTEGGILLPDAAQEKPQTAVVVMVGPGKANKDGELIALPINVGTRVLISRYAGIEVPGCDRYTIVRAEDVICEVAA